MKSKETVKDNKILCGLDNKTDIDISLFAIITQRGNLVKKSKNIVLHKNKSYEGISIDFFNNLFLNLNTLNSSVEKITIGAAISPCKLEYFETLNASIYFSSQNEEFCRFSLEDIKTESIYVATEVIVDKDGNWKMISVNDSYEFVNLEEFLKNKYDIM